MSPRSTPLQKLARKLATRAQTQAWLTVLVDSTGRVHAIPAPCELIGVYDHHARAADVLEDLIEAKARPNEPARKQ